MQAPIVIDREGHWFMEGLPVINHKVKALFQERLERDADGRHLIRLGPQVLWVQVEDAPFRVRHVQVKGSSLILTLDDGSQEQVGPEALFTNDRQELYARVRQGRLTAKLERSALAPLMPHLTEQEGHVLLRLGPQPHRL